ncbi:Hypothetical predicted protein [Paramuricea clavata]|uniref:Uncharacterized protein n=1 Tax=Paramuricea clavata TaxID=317549 RepID=A0A6S7GLK6_PARCT|nr:Hypothetical predicted protein [Paramuricea clavata]
MHLIFDEYKYKQVIDDKFAQRGIVANILTNSKNTKGNSLYLYGSFKEHSMASTTRTKIRNEEDASFSLPPTLTEKTFKTRQAPRFYTVDTTGLRQQNNNVDHALDQLITNSDLTDLKDIYHRICKGNVSTLQTLVSKKKISQKFVFVQNSSPLHRYPQQTRRLTAKNQEPGQRTTVDQPCRNRENATSQKTNKRVLVPSPYFDRTNNEKTSISEASSQHILYPSSFARSFRNNACKRPIEPTVINLNYKLPELGKDRNSKFPAKNRMKKQRWGSSGCNKKD